MRLEVVADEARAAMDRLMEEEAAEDRCMEPDLGSDFNSDPTPF